MLRIKEDKIETITTPSNSSETTYPKTIYAAVTPGHILLNRAFELTPTDFE
jgi:hypothetical protein